jgi:hypothetical protein
VKIIIFLVDGLSTAMGLFCDLSRLKRPTRGLPRRNGVGCSVSESEPTSTWWRRALRRGGSGMSSSVVSPSAAN